MELCRTVGWKTKRFPSFFWSVETGTLWRKKVLYCIPRMKFSFANGDFLAYNKLLYSKCLFVSRNCWLEAMFLWVFQVGGTVVVLLGISAPKKKSAVNRPSSPWEPLAPKAAWFTKLQETNSWWKRVKISCTKRGSIHLVRLFLHFLSWKISRTFRRRRPDVKASLQMKNFLPRMPALEVWLETMQIQMLLSIWRWVLCPNCSLEGNQC